MRQAPDAVRAHAIRLSITHCVKAQEKPSWDHEILAGQRELIWIQTERALRIRPTGKRWINCLA
jgi:hypothetical protein